jgi:DivIVA domain-containing protein
MELTPETLHAVEFREARRGGYNTRDVDDFIEQVAAALGVLQDRLRDAMVRAESAERRLVDVQRQLEQAQRRPAAPEPSGADDTLRRTLVLAQRTADATIKEAKDEAARLVSEAREEAARIRSEIEAEARRGTEGARQAAEAELQQLLETRDALKRDVDALSQRTEDQRERLRAGLAELQRVLDDPNTLQPLPPLQLTEVEAPATPSRSPLPMRKPRPGDGQLSGGKGASEPAAPSMPGAEVAAMQEGPQPALDRSSTAANTQPMPITFAGADQAPSGSPWPSELHTSVGDRPEGITIEPGSRPSEWGKRVFDRGREARVEGTDDSEGSRFGR